MNNNRRKTVKIIIYCQHILGVGHFFRTLEIVTAMDAFDVILVTGGGAVEVDFPAHVRQVKLPGLMMDDTFSGLHSVDPQRAVDEVKHERKKRLLELFVQEQPDLFLIELYPFGRKAFRFELEPVLEYLKDTPGTRCRVLCSLRDILVEKEDAQKHEKRVVKSLNQWFDAVLVHSDPQLITLDATFGRLGQVNVPLMYTGFVTPAPNLERVRQFRLNSGLKDTDTLIVASAGGGNVGAKLLRAVAAAYRQLPMAENSRLQMYTGPYMEDEDKKYLNTFAGANITVEEFTPDFVSLLGASDLSISMAGYNTCMNIVAAGVPALVWPFGQNGEQRERAVKLTRFAPMTLLEDSDLLCERLCTLIEETCRAKTDHFDGPLNINGAKNSVKWIENLLN